MKRNETHLKTRGYTIITPEEKKKGLWARATPKKLHWYWNNRGILCHVHFVSLLRMYFVDFCTMPMHWIAWIGIQWHKYCKHMRQNRKLRFTDVGEWHFLRAMYRWYICSLTAFTRSHTTQCTWTRIEFVAVVFQHAYLHSFDIIETFPPPIAT